MANKITAVLDDAYESAKERTLKQISDCLPSTTVSSILKWKYGAYGWTSPVNLLLTAAWYKHVVPTQDVCRIWAADHNKKPIPGGYAIRTNDEKHTVPLVTKVGIASGFCSPNSGMQGSRAIEKMRGAGRIERSASIDQAVSFDMALFQTIINDINDCNADQAFDVLCLLIRIGLDIKEKREGALQQLATAASSTGKTVDDIVDFAQTISDPQFVRIIAATMVESFITTISTSYELHGMQGSKTAADAQSKAAGDFWFINPSTDTLVGVEVKDKTKQIGFEILQAIENRKKNNPTMTHYIAVSAAPVCRQNIWH